MFATYVSARGHAFIDRALYLPKSWSADPARLAAAHVREAVAFATKPALAVHMIQRALTAEVPFSWVAADAVYGVGDVEQALRRACKGYVLGVRSDHHFGSWAGKPAVAGTAREIARDLEPVAWRRLSAGEGTKGARLHDWAYCELADLDADEYDETKSGLWTRGLLIRRNISDGDPPSSRHGPSSRLGALPGRTFKPSLPSKAIAGRSKTASKPPRTNSASTTTKPGPGMAGIAQ